MYQQRNRFDRGGMSDAPVKVGDEIEVKIEAVGEKGDGIAKKNGFVIFVPGAKEGQTVKIKVTRVLKKMAFSEIAGASSGTETQESQEPASGSQESTSDEDFSGEDSEDFGEEEQNNESEEEWK